MADQLRLILGEIQRRGGIGRGPLEPEIAHAEQFATVVGDARVVGDAIIAGRATTVVDLGSGGGLPGLVIAVRCPGAHLALIERRAKRADLLRYGVHALGLGDRVAVVEADAAEVPACSEVITGWGRADVVTARSFGPPSVVAGHAARLLAPGGRLVVSEPPGMSTRWSDTTVRELGFRIEGRRGAVQVLRFDDRRFT